MIREVIDPHSGAILFKEDEETLSRKRLEEKVASLERKIESLEQFVKKLIALLEDSK